MYHVERMIGRLSRAIDKYLEEEMSECKLGQIGPTVTSALSATLSNQIMRLMPSDDVWNLVLDSSRDFIADTFEAHRRVTKAKIEIVNE